MISGLLDGILHQWVMILWTLFVCFNPISITSKAPWPWQLAQGKIAKHPRVVIIEFMLNQPLPHSLPQHQWHHGLVNQLNSTMVEWILRRPACFTASPADLSLCQCAGAKNGTRSHKFARHCVLYLLRSPSFNLILAQSSFPLSTLFGSIDLSLSNFAFSDSTKWVTHCLFSKWAACISEKISLSGFSLKTVLYFHFHYGHQLFFNFPGEIQEFFFQSIHNFDTRQTQLISVRSTNWRKVATSFSLNFE